MKLGEIMKEYRAIYKLTMQDFADQCGMSKGYISMLEKGVQPGQNKSIVPSITTISKIAKAMNIQTDDLVAKMDGQSISLVREEKPEILQIYESLNEQGKEKLMEYAHDLLLTGRYKSRDRRSQMVERQAK